MSESIPPQISKALAQLKLPKPDSHKGQNGKLMIIGGSELFHAASKWSLDVASKFVDMVFYSSVPANNELVKQAKQEFWNGIVVERGDLESYIREADCILIGPGMTRTEDTEVLTNRLLNTYANKKWVIDAGALQMVDPRLLNENHILTPHYKELTMLAERAARVFNNDDIQWHFGDFLVDIADTDDPAFNTNLSNGRQMSQYLGQATLLLKGQTDFVITKSQVQPISGGNAGMTKGGTGDVLAGLVAALYCTHDAQTAAIAGSYFNKKAGDFLYESVGPFFNSSELVEAVPKVVWQYLKSHSSNS